MLVDTCIADTSNVKIVVLGAKHSGKSGQSVVRSLLLYALIFITLSLLSTLPMSAYFTDRHWEWVDICREYTSGFTETDSEAF